jgi:hypothetical protein
MDPDANITRQLELSAQLLTDELTAWEADDAAIELAELVQALNGWLHRGGALPAAWEAARDEYQQQRG